MKGVLKREGRWIGASAALTAAAFAAGVLALGQSPLAVFALLRDQIFLSPYGCGQILYKATTLIFTGLACALSFRCGLFNIGAEGQLYAGAFVMTAAALHFHSLPGVVALPLCLLLAAAGGGLWGLVPGYLKARRGAHEVITTMMMNFIALALTNYLVSAHYHMPETIHTAELPAQTGLPLGGLFETLTRQSALNFSLVVAIGLAFALKYFLWSTPLGFELRAVGANPTAARTSGVPVDRRLFLILVLSGCLSGLAGINFILGYKHYFEQGFAASAGFMGIAVALVAKNNPIGVIFAALLFAFLSQAGLTVNRVVPRELFEILQSAVIFIVVICQNRLGGGAVTFLASVLRISGPYALAALAGTFSEVGGVVNIALEGILLDGALAAVLATYWTGSPWLGVLAGILAGVLTAALHAVAALRYRVDQVVSGLAVNFLAAGLCRFVLKLVFHSTSNSYRVEGVSSWGPLDPFLVLAVVIVWASHWTLSRTTFGLRLRAVGEHPRAAATLGIPVLRLRLWGVLLSGALAGLGGAWLALEQHQFTDGMSGGRGYIALAAVIFGRWTPLGAAGAALFFGLAEASQIILQTYGLRVPTQFVQMVPYVLTLAAVAGLIGRSTPPAADGIPYSEEQD